jgi:hypothetical protein
MWHFIARNTGRIGLILLAAVVVSASVYALSQTSFGASLIGAGDGPGMRGEGFRRAGQAPAGLREGAPRGLPMAERHGDGGGFGRGEARGSGRGVALAPALRDVAQNLVILAVIVAVGYGLLRVTVYRRRTASP